MPADETVLVLAPTGRDSALIRSVLENAGFAAEICTTPLSLCESIRNGAGAAVVSEEGLTEVALQMLADELSRQPPWSDFPLVVLSEDEPERAEVSWQTIGVVESIGNVTLLERPIHEITLTSAVKVALRARRKQYQVRDYLAQRELTEAALRESQKRLREQADQLDSRVRQRTTELLIANKELEGFTYSIAHDLRSPLRRLMFTSRTIESDYRENLDEEGKAALKDLAGEAKKLSVLVEDLLQYARLGRQPVNARLVNVSELACRLFDEMNSRHAVKCCIEPGIRVEADPSLLELVLRNLIDNAYKYSRKTANPTVWIGFDRDEGALFVKDNGIGFEMEFADKIFQPFERLHRDSEYPGSGIGLANVRRIVERHGGRVWAKSAPGEGATFFFTLCEHATCA